MENFTEDELLEWIDNNKRFNDKQTEIISKGFMDIECDGECLMECEGPNDIKDAFQIPLLLAKKLYKEIQRYNGNDISSSIPKGNDDDIMKNLIQKAIKSNKSNKSNKNKGTSDNDNDIESENDVKSDNDNSGTKGNKKNKEFQLHFVKGMNTGKFETLSKKVNKKMTIRAVKMFYIDEFMPNKNIEPNRIIMEINDEILQDYNTLKHYKIKDNRNLIKVRIKVNASKQYNKKIWKCLCGKELVKMTPKQAYGNYCSCDICEANINVDDEVYHCPKGKNALQHPYGYDVCKDCVINNKQQVKSYGSVQCLCGALLDQTYPVDAYPGLYKTVVKCHNCLKKCPSNVLIYHCPKGKISDHQTGFDLCAECAIEYISYSLSFRDVKCTCGNILTKMKANEAPNVYGSVICSFCKETYRNHTTIYHCKKYKCPEHPNGFDICQTCLLLQKNKQN